MIIDWKDLDVRLSAISQQLTEPSLEVKKRKELQQEHSYLKQLLDSHNHMEALKKQLDEIDKAIAQSDAEMRELYLEEREILNQSLSKAQTELENVLFPPDPLDDRSVFVEVRAGTGGQEAALFAADLLKMYTNYALAKGWQVSLVDSSPTDLGGIREATLHIEGKRVYGHLKHESGVHRVQRVPRTEASGRVHTSTATVAILPEAEEVDVTINPADLRVDTYRAGGAGGQHVNKTDSAVRITHIPTGIVVACQDERSQHKNRNKAMKVLQSRILAAQREKHEAEVSQQRKEMVGAAARAEKVRTYNFPQNRITDHQVDITLKKLDIVMQGVLDELIEPLMEKERQDRRKHPILKK
jgi:peptide chain release factor 1